jgi:phytoene desaturase
VNGGSKAGQDNGKSVDIVGAGLAGLAAGVHAQLAGYRSHIYEHGLHPGGVAAWWRRGEYTMDGAIHFLMAHREGSAIYDLYRELGTASPDTVIDMTEFGRFVDEPSGRSALVSSDLGQTAASLKALSAADAQAVEALMAGARAFRAAGALDLEMGGPPELASKLDGLKMLWSMRRLLGYFRGRHAESAAQFALRLHDPTLSRVVAALFMPEAPMWFLYMVLAALADRQMGLLTQGCRGFVKPIEERYLALGGEVTYGATVEEVLVADDRAVGLRLADGRRTRADAVISAADGHETLFDLLGGRFVDAASRERYRSWKMIRPVMMITLGVAREFAGEAHFTTYNLAEPIRLGDGDVGQMYVRLLNYSPHFAPPGKTVVQVLLDSDWEHWQALERKGNQAYEDEKARVSGEALRRLEGHFPGIGQQVEESDVATPVTTWNYTRNYRGAYMGWMPTASALMTALPRTLPGLGAFVMAGQWVVPGGGVFPCLASGRDAVRILCRRDGTDRQGRVKR